MSDAPLLVTGANGQLGRRLCARLSEAGRGVRALVRSERAAATLAELPAEVRPEVSIVDYTNVHELAREASGCDAAIHLVGILKETRSNRYADAHEATCRALADAAETVGLRRLVTLSILGADLGSPNACLASRGRADQILLDAATPAVVIRVPMVLGSGDPASNALRAQARGPRARLVAGGASLEQPIAARDVVDALIAALDAPGLGDQVLELAGPESLSHRALVERAAAVLGSRVDFASIPPRPGPRLRLGRRETAGEPAAHPLHVGRAGARRPDRPGPRLRPARHHPHPPGRRPARGLRVMSNASSPEPASEPATEPTGPRRSPLWQRAGVWALSLACFVWLYLRIDGAAAREGTSALPYLAAVFTRVSWGQWLALMIPYSAFYFLVDSTVVWRVVSWFNARVPWADILPIRASAYILSILNEQVGKGAMALYLHRRHGVPGWEVGSSMLFIMFCELFYLTFWASVGYALAGDALPDGFALVPWVAAAVAIFFAIWIPVMRGHLLPGLALRQRPILRAFREASLFHYVGVALLRSPALLAAALVYTLALRLFGVEASFLGMLGVLPVIFFAAAVPTPMRLAAITVWVVLFPDHEAELSAFGLVMHNFFIFFNAAIGLLFLNRANRELLG